MKIKRFLLSALMGLAALSGYSQFSVGVRDNRHVWGQYCLKNHYTFRIEQSVYAEKIGFQTLRGYVGYESAVAGLDYKGEAYFGSAYNGNYYSAGAMVGARYKFLDILAVGARVNPHYDSTLGYKTCFAAGVGVGITKSIDILAGYTTIPEYRMSEQRVQAGFSFHVNHLRVVPRLSIATKGSEKAKTLRALMSFDYTF